MSQKRLAFTPVTLLVACCMFIVLGSVAVCMRVGPFSAHASTLVDPVWQATPESFQQPPGHLKMLAKLEDILASEGETNIYLGDANWKRARAKLKDAPQDMSDRERFDLYYDLATAELTQGNDQLAIEYFEICWGLFPTLVSRIPHADAERFVFELGVAHLRFGETQNCCSRKGPDNCVLPIQGSGIHNKEQGSRKAIAIFTELLQHSNARSKVYWKAMWLLNIAHMTINTYPNEVPEPFLIPPGAFESEEPFPRFPNIAERCGLDLCAQAGSVISDDFNNDGWLDLIISGYDAGTQLRIFVSNQDGTFTERTKEAGLLGILGGSGLMQADYDNDGFVDFFMMRGGWVGDGGVQPISLIHNNGNGTFTDVTYTALIGANDVPSHSGGWADYDNDGYLDFFVCGEFTGDWYSQKPRTEEDYANCQLFHNNGDGTFTEVAEAAGVTNRRFAKGASWGDYDGDRFADLYVSNMGQPNRLYHNNGDGTFTDVAVELDVTRPSASFACWFWDANNDGLLDIYCTCYAADPDDLAMNYRGIDSGVDRACLYMGKPGGGFEESAKAFNLIRPNGPMGANFGDLDNDGYPDFYLGTGRPAFSALMPNVMYHNRGGKSFADVTTAGGFGNLQKGHGISFADLDNDGDQDVFAQMGGAIRADKFYNTVYENPGFGNHWLGIKLVGTKSNRSAIGARIRADILENGQPRSVYKWINSGGSFGASPMRPTIGLGKANKIERLEIFWPTTGKSEVFADVAVDRYVRLVEGEGHYSETPLKSFRLGGNPK